MILTMLHRFIILALVMLAIGIATCGIMILIMARMLLRPRRMTDPRAIILLHRLSPADLGMEFEDVTFNVIDESKNAPLRIAGWWIPTPNSRGRCAVILHGYSDAKVGGIAWAPLLRSLGFNILAIDLRADGESGGAHSSAGFWERHDVNQVLDQTKAVRPSETRQILLFGISLGAATAAATAVLRDDLWAVILEGPFADFHTAAALHADRLGTPGPFFRIMLIAWQNGLPTPILTRSGPRAPSPKSPAPSWSFNPGTTHSSPIPTTPPSVKPSNPAIQSSAPASVGNSPAFTTSLEC